jgi:hypothetical protein
MYKHQRAVLALWHLTPDNASANEKEYALNRNQILDMTLWLIYTKGYEQMAIQDILAELQISNGRSITILT